MKLSEHIAKLLLSHDCVIIPNFGGFVAYREPAMFTPKRNVLSPSKREIGFNANLTHNDGLLAQDYMRKQNCTFEIAERLIDAQIKDFLHLLKENGKATFGEIGIFEINENGVLNFLPNTDFCAKPQYYGLDEFCFYPKYVVRKNRLTVFMQYAAAVAAALLLLLPSNFDTRQNEAFAIPIDWNKNFAETQPAPIVEENVDTIAATAIEQQEEIAQSPENYHVIIASFATERQAKRYLQEVADYDFQHIHIVHSENRYRIAVQSFSDNDTAADFLANFCEKYSDFSSSWIFAEQI